LLDWATHLSFTAVGSILSPFLPLFSYNNSAI
jgi:hypothetical protein